ncbi:hypothetical protein HBI17_168650 [Parastagonospora nodorum]|nr:hypothetical protein HBI45_196090 [Parastagonospora nodorum]KAH5741803.1 hypothetical protein HBI17_168650 [Parastagonospora nodorum]KAH6418106.1 hypothetical protein HBI14_101110 [Parastagonospora nodorum]
MSQNHQVGPYEDALEVTPQQHAYTYPANGPLPIYATSSSEGIHQRTPTDAKAVHVATHAAKKRLWILPLVGLSIAVIAGLIGGFIGVAIHDAREPSTAALLKASPSSIPLSSSILSSPFPSNTSSPTTTAPCSSQPAGTFGTIAAVDTGCKFRETKGRNRMYNATAFTGTSFTTICNSGWKNFAIIGLYTLTPSDCIESCVQYNKFADKRPKSERFCVGAGFIPDFVNQTMATLARNGASFNCFLQSNTTGIMPNDEERKGLEVVALCLGWQCPGP